jgi:hypothetical protein
LHLDKGHILDADSENARLDLMRLKTTMHYVMAARSSQKSINTERFGPEWLLPHGLQMGGRKIKNFNGFLGH